MSEHDRSHTELDLSSPTIEESPCTEPNHNAATKIALRWSEALKSPQMSVFSPGNEILHPTKHINLQHGWAVLAAAERFRTLNRLNQRSVSLLFEVTRVYDQFAQSLLKAGQSLNPLVFSHDELAAIVQQSLVFWSGETSKLSSTLRTEVSTPLQAFLTAYAETTDAIHDKYIESRRKSFYVRQRALKAESRLRKSAQESEVAMKEWKHTRRDENDVPKSLQSKVEDLHRRRKFHKGLVEWDNACVDQCEQMEAMALESLQRIEQDRIIFFSLSLVKAMHAQKLASDDVMQSMEKDAISHIEDNGKNGHKNLAKFKRGSLLNGSIQYDEGSGIMEAETIGLPSDIGKLREVVRSRVASRSTRIESFRILAGFLEYVCNALDRHSLALKQIIRSDESGDGLDSVKIELDNHDVSQISDLLGWIIRVLKVEADAAAKCSKKLKALSSEKLVGIIAYGDKILKAASDSEELVWKHLCEAARSQAKTEQWYIQITEEQTKARERISSVDGITETQSPLRISKQVSRSIANVFSVLPNKGEHAMKLLTPATLASIAQHISEDADEKESKGRHVLNGAVQSTAKCIEKYRTSANHLISLFDEEDKGGWGDTKSIFQSLWSLVQSSRESISKSMNSFEQMTIEKIVDESVDAMNMWLSDSKATLLRLSASVRDSSIGYKLGFDVEGASFPKLLPKFEVIDKSISWDAEVDADDDDLENESVDDEIATASNHGLRDNFLIGAESILFGGSSSRDEDEALNSLPDANSSNDGETYLSNWLKMSLTTNSMSDSLKDKLSFRKNIRRRYRKYSNLGPQTEVFVSYFWPEKVDPKTIPAIIESFSCTWRDEVGGNSAYYGRVFLSDVRLVFVSWAGKKLSLRHDEEIVKIEPLVNPLSHTNDALKVTYKKATEGDSKFVVLCGFYDREKTIAIVAKTLEEAKLKAEQHKKDKLAAATSAKQLSGTDFGHIPVLPDSILTRMEVVIRRHLRSISIQRFYELVWAEGTQTNEKPLYKPFLQQSCMDVEVGDWEFADFLGPWDQERYQQKRSVKLKVKRKTHLYVGPPIAEVKQTQYCRVEGQDRCVLGMTIEFDGIPYADSFVVQVRWVASREGTQDILVQVGVFVEFKKSTIWASQIRSGTVEETKMVHESLFECVKQACLNAGGEDVSNGDDTEVSDVIAPQKNQPSSVTYNRFLVMAFIFLSMVLYPRFTAMRARSHTQTIPSKDIGHLSQRMEKLELELGKVKKTLDEILIILKEQRERPDVHFAR